MDKLNLNNNIVKAGLLIIILVLVNIFCLFFFSRFDLTSEKRYTISDNTKDMLRNMEEDITVTLYLDGDLNSGFLRLKRSTTEMLDEFKVYAGRKLNYSFINPSAADSREDREKKYAELSAMGMQATEIVETDEEGKQIKKIVYPWAQISNGKKTVNVDLLKRIGSGSEALNISIENLEYELTNALRALTRTEYSKIAYIDGHYELPLILTYDLDESLRKHFEIHRGELGNDAEMLDSYKAVIVAKPRERFTETEKYIIDQYIMNGGRVMWLIDGTLASMDTIIDYGITPAIINDVNLDDQLFHYGVRVNHDLVMDVQCLPIPVDVAGGQQPDYQPMPWYFWPALLTSSNNPISKNVPYVKAEFASSLDLVGKNDNVNKYILLQTSELSRTIPAPTRLGLEAMNIPPTNDFFNQKNLPVAVAMEGVFKSAYTNRKAPQEIISGKPKQDKSVNTRMIVIADGDIIRNDVIGRGNNAMPQPLGYYDYINYEFGNKSFLLNCIQYLTDDEGWLNLRSREFSLRLLNKTTVNSYKKTLQIINVLLPVAVLIIFSILNTIIRRRKYAK